MGILKLILLIPPLFLLPGRASAISSFTETDLNSIENLYFIDHRGWYSDPDNLRALYLRPNTYPVEHTFLLPPDYSYPFPTLNKPKSSASDTDIAHISYHVIPLYSSPGGQPIKRAAGIYHHHIEKEGMTDMFIDKGGGGWNGFEKFEIFENGKPTGVRISDNFKYYATVWDPYKPLMIASREESLEIRRHDGAFESNRNTIYAGFADRKQVGEDLYFRFLVNVQNQPTWIRVKSFEKYALNIVEYKNNLFTFVNMPPVIESADGKTVFLIDHNLKDQFKDKTVKLLDEKKDQPTWHKFYGTRIEGGYAYFGIYLGREYASAVKDKFFKSNDQWKPTEKRVSLKYILKDSGVLNIIPYISTGKQSNIIYGLAPERMSASEFLEELWKLNPSRRGFYESTFPRNFKEATIN